LELQDLIGYFLILISGAFLAGSTFNWPLFTDPDTSAWWVWPPSFLRKFLSRSQVRIVLAIVFTPLFLMALYAFIPNS